MNTLAISKSEKIILLQMCVKLFPEFEKIAFHSIQNDTLVFFYKDGSNNGDFLIHWYQLCHEELAWRIYNSGYVYDDPVSDVSDGLCNMMIEQVWFNNYHPVNKLYEDFLKIP